MKRKIKQGSGIYAYLESMGILQHGSSADIERAKKEYWQKIRQEWKKNKRRESKSYTVFYTTNELKLLTRSATKQNSSITNFIKQASLSAAPNRCIIDRKAIGEIREALVLLYTTVQALGEENILAQKVTDTLLQQVVTIETKVMSVLQQQ